MEQRTLTTTKYANKSLNNIAINVINFNDQQILMALETLANSYLKFQ